jgi:polygalacturonase
MVTISNCLVTGSYEEGSLLDGTRKPFPAQKRVSRTGRIKFGTESNGSFRNVTITNCVFEGCHGLALESVDGALLEDFTISNITMRNIYESPIFIRLGARMRGPAGTPVGSIRRVLINNVVCYNATSPVCSILSGIPGHYLEDIKLSNILIHHQGNGTKAMAALQPAEEVSKYPDPHMFGDMPAHGFFIRHAKGLEMRDVRIQSEAEDARPPFVLEDVHGVDLFNVRFPRTANVPGFVLKEVSHFGIALSRPLPDTFLENVESREI